MSRAGDVAALAILAAGVAVQVPVVDHALSHLLAWALPAAAVLALLGWAAREAADAVRDWHWMGPPDLGPPRRRRREKRDSDREEAGRQ